MPANLTVRSREDGALLELKPYSRHHLEAVLRYAGLEASATVGNYSPEGFAEFFEAMAQDWRGWEGTRAWSSLEDELQLRATTDGKGHVYLSVRLQHGSPERWSAKAELILEAGLLDALAKAARLFEHDHFSAV